MIPESLSTKHKLSLGKERRLLEANLYNSVNMRAIPMRAQADKAEVKEALSKENRTNSMGGTGQEEFKVDQKSDHTQEPERPEAEEKQE